MEKIKYSTGAKWESIVGYSRAIRAGNIIEIAGTCAVDDEGKPFSPQDAFAQTLRIFEIMEKALTHLGGSMNDIVRTRIYVTDIAEWEDIGRAHGKIFGEIRPVTTMVEVSKLIAPEYKVEIEATAILSA